MPRLSSYISCPAPPATNTNGGSASSQVTRSGPRPPRGLSPSQGETDPPPRRGSLAQGGAPPPPPKDKPSLPSADEEPPTLPGDIYLHNIRKKIKTICLITFKTAKRRAPVRGEVRAAYSMMRAEKKGGEEVEEENGERGAKRKVSEGSGGGFGRSQGKRRTREATPDKVVLMVIMMRISGKKRKMI